MKVGRPPAPPEKGDKLELRLVELADPPDPRKWRTTAWLPGRVVARDGGRLLIQPLQGNSVVRGLSEEGKTWRRGWASERAR